MALRTRATAFLCAPIIYTLLGATGDPSGFAAVQSATDQAAHQAIYEMHAPGVAIAVEIDGRIVVERGYGLRSLSSKAPVTTNTHFEIASVSKQFTAAAVLQLAERHQLNLTDALGKYVPEYRIGAAVTIRELLYHTSGIPNFTEGNDFMLVASTHKPSFQAILGRISGKPLAFPPGSDWAYSNTNYVLLAYVIERVSGETYNQYIRQHLFGPAGMTNSGFASEESGFSDMATGYYPGASGITPSPHVDEGWAPGAGTIVSTLGDMIKWDHALLQGRIVSLRSVALMRDASSTSAGKSTGYGMGWYIDTEKGHERIWHNGATFGSSAMNATFPSDKEIIVVLDNNVGVDAETVASQVFDATH
jgi:D-alanyl-D-alanine carboxypeptidase